MDHLCSRLLDIDIVETLVNFWNSTGVVASGWENYVMLAISFILFYLAIVKKFEPLLLLPIAFGMFIINIPGAREILFATPDPEIGEKGGLLYFLYQGVDLVIFPPLIFLGIGAMTDFGPMIANPKSILLGAAAQIGILEAGSIAIIGGADGPTAIYVTTKLADALLPAIAIAAYSYMALIPAIQPPIMKLLTTKKERAIRMEQLRTVSKKEKIIFPIMVTLVVGLILPSSLPLLGMLMLGNLMKESGVVDRLSKTAQNELMNIITIMLGIVVGAKAYGPTFLQAKTLGIIALGLIAFCIATASGVLFGKLMCKLTKGKINPLIGAAGVSAVPMAARVAQKVGQETDPENYLLMHAMGPNVAGVIGSAVAAGVLLAFFA